MTERYYGGSSTKEDEELARRLQFEEQSRPVASAAMGRRYSEQEQRDMELARHFAEMDLGESASAYGHSPSRAEHYRCTTASRRASSYNPNSCTLPMASQGEYHDPFDYGSSSPRRHSAAYSRLPAEQMGHQRRNTVQDRPDSLDYYRGGRNSASMRESYTTDRDRRQSRSQSPTLQHPGYSASFRNFALESRALADRQSYHQRSNSHDRDRNFAMSNSGAEGHDFRGKIPTSPRHRRSVTCGGESSFDYARQLQSRAFNDLQRGSCHQPLSRKPEDDDLELALTMQALEDSGMGRINSDRELEIEAALEENIGDKSDQKEATLNLLGDSELARIIEESGTNFNDIPDDVLKELLGSSAKERLQLAASDPSVVSSWTSATGLHANSPSIRALRAALSGVSTEDIERRASRLDRSDGPAAVSSRTLKIPSAPQSPVRSVATVSVDESFVTDAPAETTTAVAIQVASVEESAPVSPTKKKKRRGFLGFSSRSNSHDNVLAPDNDDAKPPPIIPGVGGIPAAIPPPPGGSLSMPPTIRTAASIGQSQTPQRIAAGPPTAIPVRPAPAGFVRISSLNGSFGGRSVCEACGLTHGTFLKVFDKRFHPDCFRCASCSGRIDPEDQFKYTTDEHGRKNPHHRECFMGFEVKCIVCRQAIPSNRDGRIAFVKHPFFDKEQMCVRHAEEPHRRCFSCQRFEPQDTQFIDLMDGDRCACPACCRSVIVDSADAKNLWKKVILFYENVLKLPVWGQMRDVPVIVVGSEALNEQMQAQNSIHASSSQSMTAGVCLTENRATSKMDVVGVLCLTGLPKDLAAGVLAHESAHAWIRLHPKYDIRNPLPPQVEEGIAQLIAMLFLSRGLNSPPPPTQPANGEGPSDEKLRQYFKFTIEREKHEIYGTGYRRAAMAYRDIGIEALLTHILQYRDFPHT